MKTIRTDWLQIQLWFKHEELSESTNKKVRSFLKKVLHKHSRYIDKFFYLYEPDPHLFVAIKTKNNSYDFKLVESIRKMKRPNFIRMIQFKLDTLDAGNGELFVDMMDFFCRKIIMTDEFERKQPQRPSKDFTKFNHFIHCLMDAYFGSRDAEREFYKNQLDYYIKLSIR